MDLYELLALALMVGGIWLWLDSLKAREIGMQAAQRACAEEGLQFLDETVVGSFFRLARSDEGHLQLRRVYAFEAFDTFTKITHDFGHAATAEQQQHNDQHDDPMPQRKTTHSNNSERLRSAAAPVEAYLGAFLVACQCAVLFCRRFVPAGRHGHLQRILDRIEQTGRAKLVNAGQVLA